MGVVATGSALQDMWGGWLGGGQRLLSDVMVSEGGVGAFEVGAMQESWVTTSVCVFVPSSLQLQRCLPVE